jgi:polysaccharide biosynthesis/export protein
MKTIVLLIFLSAGLFYNSYAQDDIQIGNPYGSSRYQNQGGLYDYSDPSGINIKVQIWGYVRYPGYYVVPSGSSVHELISLAGGPNEDAKLDQIRVMKIRPDSTMHLVSIDYNDLMWEDEVRSEFKVSPLQAGNVVFIPGEPRYFVRQDISFYLSVITALASVAALIISILNN